MRIILCLLSTLFLLSGKEVNTGSLHVEWEHYEGIEKEISLSDIMEIHGISSGYVHLYISKSRNKMAVLAEHKVLKIFPVVFGHNPVDDKLMQGDRCTPEGIFKVRAKYPHRKWNKFVWIDYPNAGSWEKHRRAKYEGRIPYTASIGGEIGLHGSESGKDWAIDIKQNWTYGCIAMKNYHMNELYPYISDQTLFKIVK